MDKPYGKVAEFFFGRAACALAYSLRNRADRWKPLPVAGELYRIENLPANLSLWVANGRRGLHLLSVKPEGDREEIWRPSFLGSFLVWSAVEEWIGGRPSSEDELLCRLALSD
jgi:hypothetical protein